MYSILATQFLYGSHLVSCEKDKVRETCEKFRKFHERFGDKNTYYRIEVINDETGEIREYWNSHDNKLEF